MKSETLEKLLSQYRPEQITQFKQITIGVSNEAFFVTCVSGSRYVIRIIHLQTVESVRAEALIQQVMSKHGISTPVYLRLKSGELVGHDEPHTFTIAEYIDGEHPEHTTLKLAESLGAVMAKLHTILDQHEIGIAYNTSQWLDSRNIILDIAKCTPVIRERLQVMVDETVHIFDVGLPMAIIHGELGTNNIFAEGDQVTTIFDFETTQYAPRLLDVVFTYLSFVYDEGLEPPAILQALKAGYDTTAKTKLTPAENKSFNTALQYVSAATAAWCFSRDYNEYGEKFLKAGTYQQNTEGGSS